MPFFNWALLKSRTLHPDIGIPADDTQGLPYLSAFSVNSYQNYGLAVKANSGTNSITGFLFTANNRYLLGSSEAINLVFNEDTSDMFAIDSLSGHVFATTANGLINNPISINGNNLGWTGGQWTSISDCNPLITFIKYSGSYYVGYGNSNSGTYAIFKPGGVVDYYSGYSATFTIQPCNFYNGLYNIIYTNYSDYGFIPLADTPTILTPFYDTYSKINLISYSFSESAILLLNVNNDIYGYDGINDPSLTSSFIKLVLSIDKNDVFGFDPLTHRLLSISPNIVTVNNHAYYPVYVYNAVTNLTIPTPQQYARPVKNFTVNGHLNWRKQR